MRRVLPTLTVAPWIQIVNVMLDITVDEIGHMHSVFLALRVIAMRRYQIHAFQEARTIQSSAHATQDSTETDRHACRARRATRTLQPRRLARSEVL